MEMPAAFLLLFWFAIAVFQRIRIPRRERLYGGRHGLVRAHRRVYRRNAADSLIPLAAALAQLVRRKPQNVLFHRAFAYRRENADRADALSRRRESSRGGWRISPVRRRRGCPVSASGWRDKYRRFWDLATAAQRFPWPGLHRTAAKTPDIRARSAIPADPRSTDFCPGQKILSSSRSGDT